MFETWKQKLPDSVRKRLRRIYYWPMDTLELWLGRRDPLTPPRGKFPGYVVSGGFKQHGEKFLRLLIELADLQPDSTMLDLGCGIGRIAAPVVKYMNENGRYEGLDIVPDSIKWCQETITPRFPHAHFRLADVYNNHYHPQGHYRAAAYRFPYDDDVFDVTLLKSVFTHMLVDDVRNYVSEMARTLKPGGRCMVTYFLMNEEARRRMRTGQARRHFPHTFDVYYTESEVEPETAVAYDESFVRRLYQEQGLTIIEPIHYGKWRGQEDALFAQDIVVATV